MEPGGGGVGGDRQTDRQMRAVVGIRDRTTPIHVPAVSLMAAVMWHELPKKKIPTKKNPNP